MAVITIQVGQLAARLPTLALTASLRSGPKRYDFVPEQDEWVYARDGRSLNDLLKQELSDTLGRDVDLGLTGVSSRVS